MTTDHDTDAAPSPTPERSTGALILRRTVIALVLVVVMLVPSVLTFVITKQPSATYASMGALIGIVAVAAGGVRVGVVTAVAVALIAPLAIVSGLSPVTGAALMALMTLTVGRLSAFGLHRATMLVPILLVWPMLTPVPWIPSGLRAQVQSTLVESGDTVADVMAKLQAESGTSSAATTAKLNEAAIHLRLDSTYLAWVAAFFLIGAVVAVTVMAFAVRKVTLPAPEPHSRIDTVPYTITITVLATGATYYCLNHPKLVAGSFLIATILVLTQVGTDIQWRLTVQRVLGTLGGLLLLSGIMRIIGPVSYTSVMGVPVPLKIYGIGILLGVLAVIAKFSPRQWIYYVLIAPAAAMLNAFTTAQATKFGEQRLVDNLVGAALVLVAALITIGGTHVMNSRMSSTSIVEPTLPS